MKKFAMRFLYLMAVMFTLSAVVIIRSEMRFAQNSTGSHGASVFKIVVISILFIVIPWGITLLVKGLFEMCKSCHKLFAMKPGKKVLTGKKNISVVVENIERNNDRKKIGTVEQHVPGERRFYEQHYRCKYCGYETVKSYSKDSANV